MKKTYQKKIGDQGEKIARQFLVRKGYKIIDNNFRCREGEIDIISQKNGWLIFVEVKTRTSFSFGSGEEAVEERKLEKIESAAQKYLTKNNLFCEKWRIEIIVVQIDGKNKKIKLKHLLDL